MMLSYNRLKVLEKSTTIIVKATFNDLKTLETRINSHDGDLDIFDKTVQNFMKLTKQRFQKVTWHLTTTIWQSRCSSKYSACRKVPTNIWVFMPHTAEHSKIFSQHWMFVRCQTNTPDNWSSSWTYITKLQTFSIYITITKNLSFLLLAPKINCFLELISL